MNNLKMEENKLAYISYKLCTVVFLSDLVVKIAVNVTVFIRYLTL
jgi:hypothetical protein